MKKLLNEWQKYLTEAEFIDLAADIAGAPKDKQDFFKEKERLERKYGQEAVEVFTMMIPDDHSMIKYYNPSDTSAGLRPKNQTFKDPATCKTGSSGKKECTWHFLAFPEQPKAPVRGPEKPQRISRKGPVELPQDTIENKIKQVEDEIKKLPRVIMHLVEGATVEPVWVPHGKRPGVYGDPRVYTVRQYLYLFYMYRKCLPAADRKNFLNGQKDDNYGCEGKKWQSLPYGFNVDPKSNVYVRITTKYAIDNTPSAQRPKINGSIVDQRSLAIVRRKYIELKTKLKKLKQLKSIKAKDPTMLDPVDVTPIKEVFERYL